jgi:allophanate hydrolase subunit 1
MSDILAPHLNTKSGYWQVPNGYYKKVRQMTLNEVREQCMALAAALVDMRNANLVLSENVKLLEKLNSELKAQEAQKEVKND